MRFALLLSLACALPTAGQGFQLGVDVKVQPTAPPAQVRQVPVSQCQNGTCVTTYRLVPVTAANPAPVIVIPPQGPVWFVERPRWRPFGGFFRRW